MSDDDRKRLLRELVERVQRVAIAPPSLDAFYDLEASFVYGDFWIPARDEFRRVLVEHDTRTAWRSELSRLPSSLALWLPTYGRGDAACAALHEAGTRWSTAGPEKFFSPHHHVSSVSELAAMHVALLAGIDPVGAVEFAANLPNEQFVWGAVRHLKLGRADMVERVLVESSSTAAALLCLACEIEALNESIVMLAHTRRRAVTEEQIADADKAIANACSEIIPQRFASLARVLLARVDAEAVCGPLLRHLVRSVYRNGKAEAAGVANSGLAQLLAAISTSRLDVIACATGNRCRMRCRANARCRRAKPNRR